MTTLYDIPAELLIPKVAEELKKRKEIQPPAWAAFAKAGVHQQMPPEDPDFWYIRSASVLRRLYIDGPVGVQRMRTAYGGKRDRGSSPFQFRKGGGSSLRKILQQLEAAGLVTKDKAGGASRWPGGPSSTVWPTASGRTPSRRSPASPSTSVIRDG
jgi:small subunit ribosomal protein S19e